MRRVSQASQTAHTCMRSKRAGLQSMGKEGAETLPSTLSSCLTHIRGHGHDERESATLRYLCLTSLHWPSGLCRRPSKDGHQPCSHVDRHPAELLEVVSPARILPSARKNGEESHGPRSPQQSSHLSYCIAVTDPSLPCNLPSAKSVRLPAWRGSCSAKLMPLDYRDTRTSQRPAAERQPPPSSALHPPPWRSVRRYDGA